MDGARTATAGGDGIAVDRDAPGGRQEGDDRGDLLGLDIRPMSELP
jgi:hypothetical protein